MPIIIGIVGEKLAGKDEIAKYLCEKYAAFFVKYSLILDEILELLDLDISRRNEIDLGKGLRHAFKRGVLWGTLKKRIRESDAHMKVIVSIRLPDEFARAREMGAKFIYVTAPAGLRYQRFMERKEKTDDGNQDLEEFVAQEQEWTEIQIPALGAEADFKIENTGTLEELYAKVDGIIEKISRD